MTKIKGILFDLDGTLINSEIIHFNCWNDILFPFNVELNFESYLHEYSGISVFENAEHLKDKFQLSCSAADLVFQKERLYLEKVKANKIALMPYAEDALGYFQDLKIPMGLVTSSCRKEVEIILDNNDLRKYFSAIVTRDDVNNYKPHPEPYETAAKLLGYLTSEYVVFEDTLAGVSSATGASLTCFFVKNQFTRESDFGPLEFVSFDNLKRATQYLIDNDLLSGNAKY